jgi:hypothetical protein
MQDQPKIVPIYTAEVPLILDYLPPELVTLQIERYSIPKEEKSYQSELKGSISSNHIIKSKMEHIISEEEVRKEMSKKALPET